MIIERIYKRNKNRLEWIDALKGISMLCVMIGHYSFFPETISNLYAPFFLTAFLFVSGYSFNLEKNFVAFFIKRIKTLLWPWLWMGSLIVISSFFISFNMHSSFYDEIFNFFTQIRGNGDEGWFLVCLFCAELLFYWIAYIIKDEKYILVISLIFCLMSISYTSIGTPLPWHIQMWGSVTFFLSLGYIFKRKWETYFFKIMNKKTLIISIILYLLLLYVNVVVLNDPAIAFYTYGKSILLFFILSFVGLFMIINFVRCFKAPLWLLFIGENTLIFYGFHGKAESVFEKIFIGFIPNNFIIKLLFGLLGLVWISIFLIPLSYIIKKYFPILLGRK